MEDGFGAWDYVSFVLLVAVSVGIGIYHTWKERKAHSLDDYFLASRTMGVIPVALSSFATTASSTIILGLPAETYFYTDISYFLISFAAFFSSLTAFFFIFPVFYSLKITSIYEFLEKRFHVSLQRLAGLCYILSMVFGNGVIVHGTCISIIEIAKFPDDIWLFGFVCCCCTCLYTILGGLKAVIWADVVQSMVMYAALLTLVIKSGIDVGGFQVVIQRIHDGNRIQPPNISLDPTIRFTLWNCTIGYFFSRISVTSASQTELQRLLATRSLKKALRAGVLRSVIQLVFLLLAQMTGLFIYAYYWSCDPLATKRISSQNKIVPLFLIDVLGSTPGLCGLMVAGLVSSSISTLSSSVNSLTTVTVKDFLKPVFPLMSSRATLWLSKLLALFYGFLPVLTMHLSAAFPNVVHAAFTISYSLFGCIFGAMILAMVFPRCSTTSAMIGTTSGLVLWILMLANQIFNKWSYPYRPLSTDSCNISMEDRLIFNDSVVTPLYSLSNFTTEKLSEDAPLWIYRIAYYWHAFIYLTVTVVVGFLVSFIWKNEREVDGAFMPAAVHSMYKMLPPKISAFFGYSQFSMEDVDMMEKPPITEKPLYNKKKNCDTPFLKQSEPNSE